MTIAATKNERLWAIVQKFISQPTEGQLQTIWVKLLKLKSADFATVSAEVARCVFLVDGAREEAIEHDLSDPNAIKLAFDRLIGAFSSPIQSSWSSARGHLDDRTLTTLEHCAYAARRIKAGKPIDEAEIEKLRLSVETLRDEIIKTDIPQLLKRFLLDRTMIILTALQDVQIDGAEGMIAALERLSGTLYPDPTKNEIKFDDEEQERKSKSFFERLFAHAEGLGVLVKAATDGKLLIPAPVRVALNDWIAGLLK